MPRLRELRTLPSRAQALGHYTVLCRLLWEHMREVAYQPRGVGGWEEFREALGEGSTSALLTGVRAAVWFSSKAAVGAGGSSSTREVRAGSR